MAAKLERTRHPGIYRRGGRYVVVWRHLGKQHKSFHRTLAEAREAKANRDAGERRPTSREPLEDYGRQWIDSYRGRTARGLSERTRRSYRADLERWVYPTLGRLKLSDVEAPDVRALVTTLEQAGLRPGAVRRVVAPLRAMFATAVEDGALRSNPAREVRIGGRRLEADQEPNAKALNRVELARFLAALPDQWRLFFELLAHTGLRISEAIGLEWRDVQFGNHPKLLIRRQDYRGEVGQLKSDGSRRDIPLSPGMARKLWAARAGRDPTDRVFTTSIGTPISDCNLRRQVFNPAADRAGVPWATFHTLRHTCASLLFEAGRDVKQVAAWLGHADPAFTLKTYIHLMDDGVGDAAFLDDAVKVGNTRATRDPETAANAAVVAEAS